MPLMKDKENVLYLKSYDCDICGERDSLIASAYTITIDDKLKAVCGKCYMANKDNNGKELDNQNKSEL